MNRFGGQLFRCDNGHYSWQVPIQFNIGHKLYLACSQECRSEIEAKWGHAPGCIVAELTKEQE